jgi:hypothetical protein
MIALAGILAGRMPASNANCARKVYQDRPAQPRGMRCRKLGEVLRL